MRRAVVWAAFAVAAATARAQVQSEGAPATAPQPQTSPPPGPAGSSGANPAQNAPAAANPQANAPQAPPPSTAQNLPVNPGLNGPANATLNPQANAAPAPQPSPSAIQQPVPPPQNGLAAAPPGSGTSDAFDRACVDMLHGRMPPDERAIKALRDACANLMAGRADERLEAERRRRDELTAQELLRRSVAGEGTAGQVLPGQSSAQPRAGEGVLAAFDQAGRELTGSAPRAGMGSTRRGPIGYTLVTNPVGWFSGLGVNAELFGVFEDAPKFSWVAGARYSVTDATNGTASTFGAEGGADFFIIGRNNEGLRLGPRLELAAGRERFQSENTFARLGLGGEIGYNFVASNGITGLAALGLGGRIAGDNKNDTFASFVGGEFGPYAKVGLGFSW